jgi:hypothetical protein
MLASRMNDAIMAAPGILKPALAGQPSIVGGFLSDMAEAVDSNRLKDKRCT